MSPKSFVFSSPNLPKAKARQLHKAFPFLSLSTAQEMTARALGYPSWFECAKRGTSGPPSLGDQEAGLDTRVVRYQQANVLINYGVTPQDADRWVRAWGLTGRPTLALSHAAPLFYEWDSAINALESGTMHVMTFVENYVDLLPHHSRYPEVDRPVRLTPSVIVGPSADDPVYAIHPALSAQIPIYMRGPFGQFHYQHDAPLLTLYAPDFPPSEYSEFPPEQFNFVQYEWHFGRKHPDAPYPVVPHLIEQAQSNPKALVVLTDRAMPVPGMGDDIDFGRRAIACISGEAFAEFLRSKGAINASTVIWFRDVVPTDTPRYFETFGTYDALLKLPIFKATTKYQPCLPIYSYPFMDAPMADSEYCHAEESTCLLPLRENYERDDGGPDDEFWELS